MKAINVTPEAAAVAAGVVVLGLLAYKLTQAIPNAASAAVGGAAGLVTGNNVVTQNQANADGVKTTAYEGAGVLGTMGAAANSVSGGWFATMGENIGGWIYDTTH